MAFRPYAQYFVEQPYEKFAEGQDREFTIKLRVHPDSRRTHTPQPDSNATYKDWESALNRMKEKAKRQRLRIIMRDEEHEEFVQTQKKLRELRLIMRKRESNHLANQYRLRVNAKVSKPNSQAVIGIMSNCSSRPRNSSLFLTLPDEDSSIRTKRNPTPTPTVPILDALTPQGPARRLRMKSGFL